MSWFLVGELRRIIKRPIDAVGAKFQVQILASQFMKNGEEKEDIYTLMTDNAAKFEPYIGMMVMLEASPWARKDGSLGISMSDAGKIVLADTIT